jgi:protein-disulfide isomerase-like protein with CxxC motif
VPNARQTWSRSSFPTFMLEHDSHYRLLGASSIQIQHGTSKTSFHAATLAERATQVARRA